MLMNLLRWTSAMQGQIWLMRFCTNSIIRNLWNTSSGTARHIFCFNYFSLICPYGRPFLPRIPYIWIRGSHGIVGIFLTLTGIYQKVHIVILTYYLLHSVSERNINSILFLSALKAVMWLKRDHFPIAQLTHIHTCAYCAEQARNVRTIWAPSDEYIHIKLYAPMSGATHSLYFFTVHEWMNEWMPFGLCSLPTGADWPTTWLLNCLTSSVSNGMEHVLMQRITYATEGNMLFPAFRNTVPDL